MTKYKNAELARIIFEEKYLQQGETPRDGAIRVANALKDDDTHYKYLKDILVDQRFLPGGRIQSAVGATRQVTPYNCFVSRDIEDSMKGIVDALSDALETMRFGGGIGYNFSTLRPSGDLITTLQSSSTGPVGNHLNKAGFMDIFDAGCSVIRSAGHRRGAQMGVLRIDHPDILHFIRAKHKSVDSSLEKVDASIPKEYHDQVKEMMAQFYLKKTQSRLPNFNVSVAITDEFMIAVKEDKPFELKFGGRVYEVVNARNLWDELMRSTWSFAEPGVLFIDRINKKNNLHYCELISATNPCGEQPLPPYGACLLGSINLVKYIKDPDDKEHGYWFDFYQLEADIPHIVRAMDNVIDRAIYPLPEQEVEAKTKRRMGIGVTGMANTLEILGYPYNKWSARVAAGSIMRAIRNACYDASIDLAIEKGPFELLNREEFLKSEFALMLPSYTRDAIMEHGIRNSHLLSVAPTGTISLTAGNVSSGIEPPFLLEYERGVYRSNGAVERYVIADYAWLNYGVKGMTADEISAEDHVKMLNVVSKYVDSAVSKTCNVGPNVSYEDFKKVYMDAYDGGSSGCTTYRAGNIEDAPLQALDTTSEEEGAACFIDPTTGQRSCE